MEEHTQRENRSQDEIPTQVEEKADEGFDGRIFLAIVVLVFLAIVAYSYSTRNTDSPDSVSSNPAVQIDEKVLNEVQANPESPTAQFELGNAYFKGNQPEQAITAYKKAIELNPDYQEAYANLGVVYYQIGDLELAATQYQKALELDPKDGEVAYNLGALYLQQAFAEGSEPNTDLVEQAIEQLNTALELSPKLAEAHFTLGVAYSVLGENEKAITAFETFLDLDTGGDVEATERAKQYLETLKAE